MRLIVVGVFEGCVPGIMPLILIIPRSVMLYICRSWLICLLS